jgi:class 3 adenylate cyclase/tetratricopeptide (TPR) repeat protein
VNGASEAPVTVLLTDIEGSTDLQSRLGDLAARTMVRAHDEVVRDALARFDGHEVKAMGDGFLVSFTSSRRALECACAIQQAVTDQTELRVRIGLHAGEVIHEDEDIHGAAVAAAARIMAQARGGEIVVSDLVRQLAGAAAVRFRERGRVALKGLEGTWLLHDVLWQSDGQRPPLTAAAVDSALVGRDAELAVLRAAVDASVAGRGHVVLLAGEPGIGKTSLAVETAAHAGRQGAAVCWGSCWEGGGAPAFWPWIQVLRAHAAEIDDATLAEEVGPGAGDVLRILPELAPRLPPAPPVPELEPEQARFRLFDALTSMLCRAASRRPMFIVLDDLHWADESSLLLLGFVTAQVTANAVAIVGTYRDTEVDADHPMASVLASRRGQVVSITGLDSDAVGRLMASTAGTNPTPQLSAAVHRQTAGNPLFVAEMTRLLAARDALHGVDVGVGVPAGIREVIERRLVRLPQHCVETLTIAAVVGEEFAVDVVAAASGSSVAAVLEGLDPAVEAGAVREVRVGRYRFAHALFREVLYEGQGTIARARLHLQVGTALEGRTTDRDDAPAAELAKHFAEAAVMDEEHRAVRYAVLAGEQATAALAYIEAVTHYESALTVVDLVGGSESERAELLLDLGRARWRAGDRTGASTDIHRAVELARRTGQSQVLALAALALRSIGGVSGMADNERLVLLEEANAALGDAETPLRVRVIAGLAQEYYHAWLHQTEAQRGAELANQAVDLARRLGDAQTLASALVAQHDAHWLPGHETQRLAIATELASVARDAGDRELGVEAILLQAVALTELSDALAVGRLEEFVRQAELLHQPHFDYLAATRRATLAMIRGDLEALDRHLDEARVLASKHGEPDAYLVESAGTMARDTLRDDRAASVTLSRRAYGGRVYEEMVVVIQCLALIEAGELERARPLLLSIDLDDLEGRYLHNYGWLYVLATVAEAAARLGEVTVMAQVEARLIPHAQTGIVIAGCVSYMGNSSHYLGLIYAATDRAQEARQAFESALAAYDRLGADGWADRTRRELQALPSSPAVPTHVLRRDGDAWRVTYEGVDALVRDVKGMRDLAVLLATPGREVAAAELMAQGVVTDAGADATLDAQARREFKQRLDDLDDELGEAEAGHDLGRVERIKAERDALIGELTAATGLGGRARTLGDPAERARKAVTARIRDTIDRIAAAHPDLGRHLAASVSTGTFCCYRPARPVRWEL